MIQQQTISAVKDVGDITFVASAIATLTLNLPWVIMVLTAIYGVGRLYVLYLEVKVKRKQLKEDDAKPSTDDRG